MLKNSIICRPRDEKIFLNLGVGRCPAARNARRHFFLGRTGQIEKYTYPKRLVIKTDIPAQNRKQQAEST